MQILPYLEQTTIANAFNYSVGIAGPGWSGSNDNMSIVGTRVNVLNCPSDVAQYLPGVVAAEVQLRGELGEHQPRSAQRRHLGDGRVRPVLQGPVRREHVAADQRHHRWDEQYDARSEVLQVSSQIDQRCEWWNDVSTNFMTYLTPNSEPRPDGWMVRQQPEGERAVRRTAGTTMSRSSGSRQPASRRGQQPLRRRLGALHQELDQLLRLAIAGDHQSGRGHQLGFLLTKRVRDGRGGGSAMVVRRGFRSTAAVSWRGSGRSAERPGLSRSLPGRLWWADRALDRGRLDEAEAILVPLARAEDPGRPRLARLRLLQQRPGFGGPSTGIPPEVADRPEWLASLGEANLALGRTQEAWRAYRRSCAASRRYPRAWSATPS